MLKDVDELPEGIADETTAHAPVLVAGTVFDRKPVLAHPGQNVIPASMDRPGYRRAVAAFAGDTDRARMAPGDAKVAIQP